MIYCSLDLELTGFDPTKDEILEIGFSLFEMTESGPVIVEEWSQVFQPGQNVHPKILGLTGITQDELDAAPKFADSRDFVQKKLENAVLVGHNVALDMRFLEAFGIRLSGQAMDTLDLVQFILPTHHSYNLENLMHTFQVPHREAHRALADCKAVIIVLERLLQIFQSFPAELKTQIQKFAGQGEFAWLPLLQVNLIPRPFAESFVEPQAGSDELPEPIVLPRRGIVRLPLGYDTAKLTLSAALNQKEKILLVVPTNYEVLRWRRAGYTTGIFSEEDTFQPQRFDKFISQPNLNAEQLAFILKVLVWKYTNWQTQTILDLNLSFSGGQFRMAITGGAAGKTDEAKIVCCSHLTFLSSSREQALHDRMLMIRDLAQMERVITTGIGDRISWTQIVYVLKSVYNPETETGFGHYRGLVINALAATDLFFGLISLQLQKQFASQDYVTYANLASDPYLFSRLQQASISYVSQLEKISSVLKRSDLTKFIVMLGNFFVDAADRVKWVALGQNRCVLFNYPLDIAHIFLKAIAPYRHQVYISTTGNLHVEQYFVKRLGFTELKSPESMEPQLPALETRVKCRLESKFSNHKEIFEFLVNQQPAPVIVLFNNAADIKDFYKTYYAELKSGYAVFAQGYSGGSNKLLRNFAIRSASILLATPQLLVRSALPRLGVKTLIWADFSLQRQSSNPYELALAARWNGPTSFAAVRNLQTLTAVLQQCYSDQLQHITIYAHDLNEDDKNTLIEGLTAVPFLEIE